jgi:CRISPR-associated protein Cmr5
MGEQQQRAKGEKKAGVQYTRDQERAQHAYRMVEKFRNTHREHFKKYKSLVNGFGAGVMRSGLVAALAFLARNEDNEEVKAFAAHLGEARIPGLQGRTLIKLLGAARELPLNDYMLATREILRMSIWFRRAVQAAHAEDEARAQGGS